MLTPKKAAESLVLVFHAETVYTFERAESDSTSMFGGPTIPLSGVGYGPKPMQTLARLSPEQLPFLAGRGGSLTLIYGFCYSGCEMLYRLHNSTEGELLEMTPTQSSDSFPYPDYPDRFPVVPLSVSARPGTYADFARNIPNLPDTLASDWIALVPPPASIGISLWGEWGDAEGVTVVCEGDLQLRNVHAYNVCS